MSNAKKGDIKNINILNKIGNANQNYIKYYICYNETLQYNKKSSATIFDDFNINFMQHKTAENLIKKINELEITTNFSRWSSSLKAELDDNKHFSKCRTSRCLSYEISKADIQQMLYFQHQPNLLTINKMNPKKDIKTWCNASKVETPNDNNSLLEDNIDKDKSNRKFYKNSWGKSTHQNCEMNRSKELEFKTARDELTLQSIKKNVHNTEQNFEYGNLKKTLGTRRTPRSEFVPPIKKKTESNAIQEINDKAIMLDERLINIDPKMIDLINNEIINNLENISWDDVAGLEYAKSTIKETIIWPILRPDIFTGIRRPPKGILLFGPPGTGKTLIGKCIASQSKSKFFSISASSLTSKWIGECEKMVRALFAVACVNQPSIIFIDEIDSLLCQRTESEHESSRRLKTEFLVQLDGAGTSKDDRILIIGATNRPQELDDAARRRFVKRLYIPLPCEDARIQILQNLLKNVKNTISFSDFEIIGKITENYSGADIASLCQEACMEPLRAIPISEMLYFDKNNVRPVTLKDFQDSVKKIRPSVSVNDLKQYLEWDKLYGSGI